MNPNVPLHPAIVHFPMALAALLPLIAAVVLVAWWRGWLPGRRLWVGVIALQAILAIGCFAALRTGQNEEDTVETVVGEAPIEAHEEAAEAFMAGAVSVLVLALLAALLPRERFRLTLALVTLIGMFVVAGLAYRTGKAGGELVYEHGAAAAYAGDVGAKAPAENDSDRRGRGRGEREDDDD